MEKCGKLSLNYHQITSLSAVLCTWHTGSNHIHTTCEHTRIFNGCEVWIENSVTQVTAWHHSASLVILNSYPHDGIFNPHLTTIKDSYILAPLSHTEIPVWYARKTGWAASGQNQQTDCAPSEDSDLPSLIRVFADCMKKAWVLSYPLSTQRRPWSDWADAQADLSLRWVHSHFVGFVTRRLCFCLQITTLFPL